MKRIFLLTGVLLMMSVFTNAQVADSIPDNLYFNSAEKLLKTKGNLKLGGYGGVHYNQPISGDFRNNGKLDVHRFVMMMGYQFNSRTQFVTELEFEHVKEIYVEQMFLQYKLNDFVNLRGGLLLAPMGIVNLYHEPTVYHGVERPMLSHDIAPTTWREIGIGASGLILPAFLKYQVYVMNGFKSFDNGTAQIGGASGMRGGRQKAAESFMSSPNLAGRIEYFGIGGLNVGLSGYFGKTQSTLYDGIEKGDEAALARADSSVVQISMVGVDARYSYQGFELTGQLYYNALGNTDEYNAFTSNKGGGDLGSSMFGYYVDLGYDVLKNAPTQQQLIPFVRYSNFDTHHTVSENINENNAYQKDVITTGLSLFLDNGAVVKADMQFVKDGSGDEFAKTFNAGFGIMF
jgi:hypothetical protein